MTYGVSSLLKFLRGPAAALFCLTAFGIQKAFADPENLQVEHGLPGDVHAEPHDIAGDNHAHDPAHAEAHGSGGLPQFDPSDFPSQIFWLAIVFVVLYTIFSRASLPAIGRVIDDRESKIRGDQELAEKLKNEATAVLESYEKGLSESRAEASRLSADAAQAAKTKAEQALQSFQQKAESRMAALETSLNDSKHRAMDEMNTIAAEIASAAAEKIVGISTDLNQAKTVVQSLNKLSKKKAA